MKKILSIVAVVAIVLSLSVCAFAAQEPPAKPAGDPPAGDPPAADASVNVENAKDVKVDPADAQVTVKNDKGEEIKAEIEISEAVLSEKEDATIAAAAEKAAKEVKEIEIVDVALVDENGNEIEAFEGTVTVAIVYGKADEVAAVLYWDGENDKWDEAKFEVKDGKIVADFEHFCTVAFVLGEKADTNAGKADPGKKAPDGKPGDPKSPQTGYNTGIWALAAVAMALCAGYCFVARRKVAE